MNVTQRTLGGRSIVLNRATSETVELTGGAALIWIGVQVPGTIDELIGDIVEVLEGADRDNLAENFQRLVQKGFIVPVSSALPVPPTSAIDRP